MHSLLSAAALALALPHASLAAEMAPAADITCTDAHTVPVTGVVHDTTAALVPGATITLDGGIVATSGDDGRFRFPCVSAGSHTLAIKAEGFAANLMQIRLPRPGDVQFVLQPDTVQIGVDVTADEVTVPDSQATGESHTISGKQLQTLADDPDDLTRQLQQLAATAGGNPANATISVDGFQDSSKVPPKSSIAYIKINPDQFSAEYREPPFEGGRIEIYTKPGRSAFHGALFATNSSSWMNSSDPFSVSKAPLGKQRYGFELNGPVRKQGSDFSLELEHRSIDDFGVINATTLDSGGNPLHISQNISTPQRLWEGQARLDWQLGAKNTFIATYSPNVNSLRNVSAGGQTLFENGYSSGTYEHVLRVSDITTASAHLMHEARFQIRWDGETDVPNSNAPEVQVAGAFTGGGATLGGQHIHRFVPEFDDDAIWTTKKHTLKVGSQLVFYRDTLRLTSLFNGMYTFGGTSTAPVLDASGKALPGQTQTISGVEQYRRALLKLPGGTATAFTNVVGSPNLQFHQVHEAVYVQDDWEVGKGVKISSGLRYYYESLPSLTNGATPRLGVLWSPTKKGTWTLHGHAGLFTGRLGPRVAAEVLREDGVNRVTSTIYNATFCDPNATGGAPCNPFTDATPIRSVRSFAPRLGQVSFGVWNAGGTRTLPRGWTLSVDWFHGRIWNDTRSVNINSPYDGSPTGLRPGSPLLNNLQVTNSGQGSFEVEFAGIEQHDLKWLQLFLGGVHVKQLDDTDDDEFFSPQSAYSNAGERAPRTGQPEWQVFGNASITFPKKIVLSGNLHASRDAHYNLTTGYDNNGDGNFNDRPQYAAPGTPNSVATKYGLLVATGGNAVFPRNKGVLPGQVYLDTNLQRAFVLTHNPKAEHQQTLTVNVRSANVLNHNNVSSVGGVLGSPSFGQPYASDTGRRVEGGVRYSF